MIGPTVIYWRGSENGVMSFGTTLWSGRVAAAVNVQAIIVVKTTVYTQESFAPN